MNCPVDQNILTPRIYEDTIEVDECSSCGGIWLDRGELERIERTRENDYSTFLQPESETGPVFSQKSKAYGAALSGKSSARTRTLSCPSCGHVLYQKEHGFFSQIFIDSCISCRGVWLDKGELQDIEIFFERNKPTEEMNFWEAFTSGMKDLFS